MDAVKHRSQESEFPGLPFVVEQGQLGLIVILSLTIGVGESIIVHEGVAYETELKDK